MITPTMTGYLLLAIAAFLIIYDVFLIATGNREATITIVVYNFARENPIAVLASGIIIGHVCWPH